MFSEVGEGDEPGFLMELYSGQILYPAAGATLRCLLYAACISS